jgi:hypothetical protein
VLIDCQEGCVLVLVVTTAKEPEMPKTYKEGGKKSISLRERVNMFLTGSRDGITQSATDSRVNRAMKRSDGGVSLNPGERVRAKRKP